MKQKKFFTLYCVALVLRVSFFEALREFLAVFPLLITLLNLFVRALSYTLKTQTCRGVTLPSLLDLLAREVVMVGIYSEVLLF